MRELPLFPLHSVLCPGIALPLHIFEPRYREMIGHCLETGSPFGVVLIRDGREVGPLAGHIADVGTTAAIRQAGRYPDGRLDIVTVGETRFRIVSVDPASQAYLVGTVEELEEPLGGAVAEVDALAASVGRRFLGYLEMLQPPEGAAVEGRGAGGAGARPDPDEVSPEEDGEGAPGSDVTSDADRRAQLLASARRLIAEGDATAVSYLLTGLVQLDLAARQELLEIPDTMARLRRLDAHLAREQHLLKRHLRPMALDLELLGLRKN
jgi:Lon protease-like protein